MFDVIVRHSMIAVLKSVSCPFPGWFSSAPDLLSWLITEQPKGWSYAAIQVWYTWIGIVAIWPQQKYMLVPVFQQTTPRMLQLAQQYQAAAGELKQDNQQHGGGPSAARDVRQSVGAIATTLLRGQFGVLVQLATLPWPETEPLHRILRGLYMSSEVATAALQALVGACEDLQMRYKDMARQQQLMKRKKKKKQSDQQVAPNPLLLKLTVPADHVDVGVPPGWEEGAVEPVGFYTADITRFSMRASVCHVAAHVIEHHHLCHHKIGFVYVDPSEHMGVAKSTVCRPEVMKLLLETALLLQGTEPEAGVHHELQNVLSVLLMQASKEDALVLLRERGALLMQAATLTTAEEGVLAGGSWGVGEWVLRQQQQQEGGASTSLSAYGWLNTLVRIAGQVGKFSTKRYMWYMLL